MGILLSGGGAKRRAVGGAALAGCAGFTIRRSGSRVRRGRFAMPTGGGGNESWTQDLHVAVEDSEQHATSTDGQSGKTARLGVLRDSDIRHCGARTTWRPRSI